MDSKLKCKVIILPRTQGSGTYGDIIKDERGDMRLWLNQGEAFNDYFHKAQHLYFVSERPIKEDDWFLDVTSVVKCIRRDINTTGSKNPIINSLYDASGAEWFSDDAIGKIEATTDKSLGLPLIPQSFIERYVSEQGRIEFVTIQINKKHIPGVVDCGDPDLYDGNNFKYEITIIPTKDFWDRDEFKGQMRLAFAEGYLRAAQKYDPVETILTPKKFDEWFDANY